MRPYNDGHKHTFVYTSDYPKIKRCDNSTIVNAIWAACCECLVPLSTYQAHQKRLGKEI